MKFIKSMLKFRWVIIVLTVLLTAVCGYTMSQLKLNSDISSYLSDKSMTKKTIKFMQENFDIEGDAVVAVTAPKTELAEITKLADKIKNVKDISGDKLLWYGSFMMPSPVPGQPPILLDTGDKYYKLNDKGEGTYIFYISINAQNASEEAGKVIDNLDTILSGSGYSYFIGGNAVQTKTMLDSALGDLPIFLGVAVAIIFIILMFSSKSYLEPFIFLLTIGVSIVINLGTNAFMGAISTVTFSAAAILQLALSMDYSIYLSHAYTREKQSGDSSIDCMGRALKSTFVTVAASALTTVAGFLALLAMRFGLGFDLGIVLAKGVAISMISVLVFQSSLILVCSKLLDKTSKKRTPNLQLKPLQKFVPKAKWGIIIVAIMLVLPSIFIQNNVKYYYLNSNYNESAVGAQAVIQDLGGQNVIAVPEATSAKHKEFLSKLSAIKGDDGTSIFTDITGYYKFIEDYIRPLLPPGLPEEVQDQLIEQYAAPYKTQFFSNGYTFYQLSLKGTTESDASVANIKEITKIADEIFDGDIYVSGNTQAVIDISSITKLDFLVVSGLSALLIFAILWISLKSFKKALLLVIVIEGGIMVNLAITALIGSAINFMSYIIISSILLGATVDYAILFTTTLGGMDKSLSKIEAVKQTIAKCSFSLIISAAILVSATLSVYIFASDIIIREITFLIARGAAISCVFVLTILPSVALIDIKFPKRKNKKLVAETATSDAIAPPLGETPVNEQETATVTASEPQETKDSENTTK